MRPRQMHLNAFILSSGHHEASWRYPASTPERMFDPAFYREIARTAEAAAFDAVFLADIPKLDDNVRYNASGRLDPLVVLTTIAAATERIGLIATASTTYTFPWNLARAAGLAGLHVRRSRGVEHRDDGVTGGGGEPRAADAGPEPALRYERAEEFVEAVLALWDSWDDDAIVLDRESGTLRSIPARCTRPRSSAATCASAVR